MPQLDITSSTDNETAQQHTGIEEKYQSLESMKEVPQPSGQSSNSNNSFSRYKQKMHSRENPHHAEVHASKSEQLPVKKIVFILGGVITAIATLVAIVVSSSQSSSDTSPATSLGESGNQQSNSITSAPFLSTPSPFDDATWNTLRGSCGEPRVQPDLITSRIVGGTEATPHSWPWQISLVNFKDSGGNYKQLRHICGGTLIGPDVVITAVHCFLNKYFTSVSTTTAGRRVIVGGHGKAVIAGGAELVEILKIYHHPANNLAVFKRLRQTPVNDLTILRLKKRFNPSLNSPVVGFACLPKPKVLPPVGKRCWSSGWGSTRSSGFEKVLKQASQPLITQSSCKTYFKGVNYRNHLCARERNMGTCQGDSGGPLVCQSSDNKWTLYGATSFGPTACIAGPGVFVSVSQYMEWICCTIKDLPPCSKIKCP